MRLLRRTLMVVNAWPGRQLGEREPVLWSALRLLYFHLSLGYCCIGAILYMRIHSATLTFFDIGQLYIVLFLTVVAQSRLYTLSFTTKYRKVAAEFITKFHLFHFANVSDYSMATHKRVHLICHLFSVYVFALMMAAFLLFNLVPVYGNYAAGSYGAAADLQRSPFEHSLYFYYPFDIVTDVCGYVFAFAYNWLLSYCCGVWFCMVDLFLCLMVFHVWGHFNVLLQELRSLPEPARTEYVMLRGARVPAPRYSAAEQRYVAAHLAKCIRYHRVITTFTDKMSDCFGPMLFVNYIFHQASGCLLLLECSPMTAEALLKYLPLTVVLFQQLIQLSVVFELISTTSAKLKDAVYEMPWEYMDTPNRKTLLIFLMNVQEPVHVKALGVANVGVTSMAAILKTSLSYFTFLFTFTK